MFAIRRLHGTMFAGILGLAACFAGGTPAHAGGYDGYSYSYGCAPVCHYETVTVYVPRTVAYTRLVTLYDECGRPYQAARTCYRTVQVPVQKRVLVCDR
jgi:hypothetical protein